MPGIGGQAKVKAKSPALLTVDVMAIVAVYALAQEGRAHVLQAEVPGIGVHQNRQAHDGPGALAP